MSPAGRGARRGALAAGAGRHGGSCTATSTSQLTAERRAGRRKRRLPMSEVRNLAMNPTATCGAARTRRSSPPGRTAPSRSRRALNCIKGAGQHLDRRRGWDSALDEALFGERHRPRDAGRDARGRAPRRSPTSAATCAPKARRSGSSGWPGTTSSRRSAQVSGRGWGYDDAARVHRRAVRDLLRAGCATSPSARSASTGSTPSRGTASAAARSACRSAATSRASW